MLADELMALAKRVGELEAENRSLRLRLKAAQGELRRAQQQAAPPVAGEASPWEVLGVAEGADEAAIAAAFRERIHKAHPDKGGDPAQLQALLAARDSLLFKLGSSPA